MFEKVNKAYEFLCSKSKVLQGPDPQNIVLILKAQSILFRRYKEGCVYYVTYLTHFYCTPPLYVSAFNSYNFLFFSHKGKCLFLCLNFSVGTIQICRLPNVDQNYQDGN